MESENLLYYISSLWKWTETHLKRDLTPQTTLPWHDSSSSSTGAGGIAHTLWQTLLNQLELRLSLSGQNVTYWRHFRFPYHIAICRRPSPTASSSGSSTSAVLLNFLLLNVDTVELHSIQMSTLEAVESHLLCQWSLPPDPHRQWRVVNWSPAGDVAVLGHSTGLVQLFDRTGHLLAQQHPPQDTATTAAGAFHPLVGVYLVSGNGAGGETPDGGGYLLLSVYFSGLICLHRVHTSVGRITLLHEERLPSYCRIVACDIHSASQRLAVSVTDPGAAGGVAAPHGVCLLQWDTNHQGGEGSLHRLHPTPLTAGHWLSSPLRSWRRRLLCPAAVTLSLDDPNSVKCLTFSPSGRWLLLVYFSDKCILLNVLDNVAKEFGLANHSNASSPQMQNPLLKAVLNARRRYFPYPTTTRRGGGNANAASSSPSHPSGRITSVSWWNEDSVIVLLENGAAFVQTVGLQMLISSQQTDWFMPLSTVCFVEANYFLLFQVAATFPRKKQFLLPTVDDDDDCDEDEDSSNGSWFYWLWSQVCLYLLWSVRILQRKRLAAQRQAAAAATQLMVQFEITNFQATSPEELFGRKIMSEDYGEALNLARRYHLDTDVIYQKQWRHSAMHEAAIEDYLMKISKRDWVLQECLQQVPPSAQSMRALLQFGLKLTDVDTFVELMRDPNYAGFRLTDSGQWMRYEQEHTASAPSLAEQKYWTQQEREAHALALREAYVRDQLAGVLSSGNLAIGDDDNDERLQHPALVEILQARVRLLRMKQQLDAYELVLLGEEEASGGKCRRRGEFSAEVFRAFRNSHPISLAEQYAREQRFHAMLVMKEAFPDALQPHWLLLLDNIPETVRPKQFEDLLPAQSDCAEWCNSAIAPPDAADWCWQFSAASQHFSTQSEGDARPAVGGEFLLSPQQSDAVVSSVLELWYCHRILQVERLTGMGSVALELAEIALTKLSHPPTDRLVRLHSQLQELCLFTYQCRVLHDRQGHILTLHQLQSLPPMEKIHLLMSTSTPDTFIRQVARWLFPFLHSLEEANNSREWSRTMLRNYLLDSSHSSLQNVALLLSAKKSRSLTDDWLLDNHYLFGVALQCLANYDATPPHWERDAEEILNSLPSLGYLDTPEKRYLNGEMNALRGIVECGKVLRTKWAVSRSMKFLLQQRCHHTAVLDILHEVLHQQVSKSRPSDCQWKHLQQLKEALLRLVSSTLVGVHPKMVSKLLLECLLQSGELDKMKLSVHFMNLPPGVGGIAPAAPPPPTAGPPTHSKGVAAVSTPLSAAATDLEGRDQMSAEEAITALLQAAKQYTNNAIHWQDEAVQLAQFCLNLVPTALLESHHPHLQQEWQQEMNLLEAFAFLDPWQLDILPMEIRQSQRPVEFVQRLLRQHPDAYKQPEVVFQAALLLGIEKDHFGAVLKGKCLAEAKRCLLGAAMQREDLPAVVQWVSDLLDTRYSPCWVECVQLLQHEALLQQMDYNLRMRLLAFSVSACPDKQMMSILQQLCETYAAAQKHHHTTGAAVVADSAKKSFTLPLVLSGGCPANQKGSSAAAAVYQLPVVHTLRVHPLYRRLHCCQLANYYSRTEADTNTTTATTGIVDSIVSGSQLCNGILDIPFTALASCTVFENLLQGLLPQQQQQLHHLHQPESLALALMAILWRFGWQTSAELYRAKQQPRNTLLRTYVTGFEDAVIAVKLGEISPLTDLPRFLTDPTYRRDTVLGLCLTDDSDQLQFAFHIAKRYQVDLLDAKFTALEFLLLDSTKSAQELADLLLKSTAMRSLPHSLLLSTTTHLQARCQRLYDSMDPHNLRRLQVYFHYLKPLGATFRLQDIALGAHCKCIDKLLTTLGKVGGQLHYHRLVSGRGETALEAMRPFLTESNVPMFAKLTGVFKQNAQPGVVQPTHVYLAWLQKWIFDVSDLDCPTSTNESGSGKYKQFWLNRIKSRKEELSRLAPNDFYTFVEHLFFSDQSAQLTAEVRKDILELLLKLVKHLATTTSSSSSLLPATGGVVQTGGHIPSYEALRVKLTGLLRHFTQHLQQIFTQLHKEGGLTLPRECSTRLLAIPPSDDLMVEVFSILLSCSGLSVAQVQQLARTLAYEEQLGRAIPLACGHYLQPQQIQRGQALQNYLTQLQQLLSSEWVERCYEANREALLRLTPESLFFAVGEFWQSLPMEKQTSLRTDAAWAMLRHSPGLLPPGFQEGKDPLNVWESSNQQPPAGFTTFPALESLFYLCRLYELQHNDNAALFSRLWKQWTECVLHSACSAQLSVCVQLIVENVRAHRALAVASVQEFMSQCVALLPAEEGLDCAISLALHCGHQELIGHAAAGLQPAATGQKDLHLALPTLTEIVQGGFVPDFAANQPVYKQLLQALLTQPALRLKIPDVMEQLTERNLVLEAAHLQASSSMLSRSFCTAAFIRRLWA